MVAVNLKVFVTAQRRVPFNRGIFCVNVWKLGFIRQMKLLA